MNIKGILSSSLSRTIGGTLLVRVFSVGATFLCSVLLARLLGAESFGIYSYVLAIVSLLALPTQAGMPTLVLRETAKAKTLKKWEEMKGVWLWSGTIVVIISLSVFIISLISSIAFFESSIIRLEYQVFILGLIMSLLVAMGNVRGAALRGLGFIIKGQLPESLIKPILFLALMMVTFLFEGNLNPATAMTFNLIAALISFLIGAWLLYKVKPNQISKVKPIIYNSTWLRTLIPLAVMVGMQSMSGQVDILILGFLSTAAEVGVYKIVISGAALAVFGLQVVSMVITPRLANAFANNNIAQAQKISSLGSIISFALTLPVVIVFYLFGTEILNLVFGKEYIVGNQALLIVAIGQAINAFFGSSVSILTMSGNERFVIIGMLMSTVANIILNIVLVPSLGINGAAIGATTALLIWNVYIWTIIKVKLNIDCTMFGFTKGV